MRHTLIPLAGAAFLALTGCGDLAYRGIAPSVRTFADKPTVGDYYVGMNARFAVLEPEDKKRLELDREAQLAAGKTPAEIRRDQDAAEKKVELLPDTPGGVPGPDTAAGGL